MSDIVPTVQVDGAALRAESPIGIRLMDAHDQVNRLDAELHEVLCTKGGIDGYQFHDWHFDSYDLSIEFDGCKPDWRLSEKDQQVLWAAGFLRCWLNHTDGWETAYLDREAFKAISLVANECRTFKPEKRAEPATTAENRRDPK